MTATEVVGFTGHVLPRGTRPTAADFAGIADPDVIWEDSRWWRFTERTDLHEVRYLEVRADGRTVAIARCCSRRDPGACSSTTRPGWREPQGRWPNRSCSITPIGCAGPN